MKGALLGALLLLCQGCMTFNGAELPRRELPDVHEFRPLIATEIGEVILLYNGKDSLKPPMSARGIGDRAMSAVLTRWKGAKLIEDYDPPGELDGEPSYKLRISGTQNEQGSFFASFVTGFTLFIFPSSSTLEWEWNWELTDLSRNKTFTVSTKNSLTTWMQLIFLPVFPFSIVGAMNADSSLSSYVYDEFAKQGAWKRDGAVWTVPHEISGNRPSVAKCASSSGLEALRCPSFEIEIVRQGCCS